MDPMISHPTGHPLCLLYKMVGPGAHSEIIPSEYSSQCCGHQNPEFWLWQLGKIIVENLIIAII